ncbi:hypothetical protein [Marichromatium bheemlicum]|uniref:NERD domain-containing protein n=1 Tax=Marichromatium bheemlicum TaxID=365339 RepID=A0ABX1IA94_9GAMM|nr:hypothetical protein [Marichromatium bheemlicum]NKN34178.1 hypothetical protein [Marichromatium bheemlicum]
MLLDIYQQQELFWLKTLFGTPSRADLQVFRGEFVVLEGELKTTTGKRSPPKAVLKQAVLVADETRLRMVAGNFASIDELPEFVTRFHTALAADCRPLLFVDNIAESAEVEILGHPYVLIQHSDGVVWNALTERCYLDKQDLKGLSGEDKVIRVFEALADYRPGLPSHDLETLLATKTEVRRATWGAV